MYASVEIATLVFVDGTADVMHNGFDRVDVECARRLAKDFATLESTVYVEVQLTDGRSFYWSHERGWEFFDEGDNTWVKAS